jgi:hypothetical protein
MFDSKIPLLNIQLPDFFRTSSIAKDYFHFKKTQETSVTTTAGSTLIFYLSAFLIVLDIILVFVVLSFGSMRSHVKKIEARE